LPNDSVCHPLQLRGRPLYQGDSGRSKIDAP
jgi:hypothetical protein